MLGFRSNTGGRSDGPRTGKPPIEELSFWPREHRQERRLEGRKISGRQSAGTRSGLPEIPGRSR